MAILLSDLTPIIKDYCRNQNLDNTRLVRAINTASSIIFAMYGIPGQEREYSFDFFEEQNFYAQPADFNESLSLRYDDKDLNVGGRFSYRPSEFLFEKISRGTSFTGRTLHGSGLRLWGPYTANGTQQMLIIAGNSRAGMVVDTFDADNATYWTASDDATNITTDTSTKEEGLASLAFDIDVSASANDRGTITATALPVGPLDMNDIASLAHARVYCYIPSITDFTSVTLNWGSDASNYYVRTITAQQDGSAFAVGWNELDFPWDSSVSQVGSPDLDAITFFALKVNFAAGYTDQTGFRFDYLRFVVPDTMIETYYTNYKGENASGTDLINFTTTTDKFFFANQADDVMQLIAMQAAIIISPTILVENVELRRSFDLFHKLFSRKYPKKKINNLMADPKTARTSNPI